MTLEDRLREILRADPITARAMEQARTFALPDCWIVSGVLYNTVWNALTGKPSGHGIKDIDLFYWDVDTSWEAEDQVILRGAAHFSPTPPVEIRNQARVHLWYESRFGRAIPPIPSSRASIADFAAKTHAVGVRIDAVGEIEIEAPYGLDAIFDMRIVPNPRNANRATHEEKAARQKALWPELVVEPWPEEVAT
ncbi:MAG: nucleotidyltransferase family protein [Pseudomonadota bacterium]